MGWIGEGYSSGFDGEGQEFSRRERGGWEDRGEAAAAEPKGGGEEGNEGGKVPNK